jgi:comEA protein
MNRKTRTLATLLLFATFALAGGSAEAAESGRKVVNVNKADAAQLALLPRVGPAVAQRILEHREKNGQFKSAEDLMLVRGIGEKTFEGLKPYVAVSGETTLKEKVRAGKSGSAGSGETKGSAPEEGGR